MRIKKMVVGELSANCYIIADEKSGDCIAVDPGAEPLKIIKFIEDEKLKLNSVVLTHGHYDHIGGCLELKDRFKSPVIACEGEEEILKNCRNNLASSMFGDDLVLNADKYIKDGEKYKFGSLEFKAIKTPGHTPGGMCLYFEKEKVLFSGDTLFFCSVGRTDFYLGDTDMLLASLKRLSGLDDDVVVYPGHGQETSIGFEKVHNPYME